MDLKLLESLPETKQYLMERGDVRRRAREATCVFMTVLFVNSYIESTLEIATSTCEHLRICCRSLKMAEEESPRESDLGFSCFLLQGTMSLTKRIDEIRLLESRKSARLADQDTDFARLADMAGDRKRASSHSIDVPHVMA